VERNLVIEEVEIHPGVGGTAFLAAQNVAVEPARLVEIGDVIGEMEERTHAKAPCWLNVDISEG
jgi:hypothetical protein